MQMFGTFALRAGVALIWHCVARLDGLVAGDAAALCVAGVALMALGWLWWRAWAGLVAGDAAALCVAGVALGDIHLRFAWQALHLVTSTFVVLRGRHGICVALGGIHFRFAW